MIYRFLLVSDEVEGFYREIQLDSECTFLDFHKAILAATDYKDDQMTSFFICESNWEKREEITLEEMDRGSDVDSWVMAETPLSELIEDEGQRLIYIFDPMTDRCFFIELKEIITGKIMAVPTCTRKAGNPPSQTIDFEEFAKANPVVETGENFYGDEDFEADELDSDGFDMGESGGSDTVSLDSIDDLY